MKKDVCRLVLLWCFAILFLFALSPLAEAEEIYSSVIRLHVLANSDSEEDQRIKLAVRDEILKYAEKNFSSLSSLDQAKAEVEKRIPELESIAVRALSENGVEEKVKVCLEEEYYPTRIYESLSLPSGRYLSLKIEIGKAEGKNWWCVLFPPICLNSATEAEDALISSGWSGENIRTVTKDGKSFEVRFKTIEFFQSLREKFSASF